MNPRLRGWLIKSLVTIVVGSLVLTAGYLWFVLSWAYSDGERAGYVQKLSKKGWLCKTWEGEIVSVSMPGTAGEKFLFTVRDEAVANKINDLLGRRVALQYEEHKGIPTSCFGDTNYFVTAVRVVDDPRLLAPIAIPSDQPAEPSPAPEPAAR